MKMKCEICKEREGKTIFIHTLTNPSKPHFLWKPQSIFVCYECEINLLTQFYGLKNYEVEDAIKFLKEDWKEWTEDETEI